VGLTVEDGENRAPFTRIAQGSEIAARAVLRLTVYGREQRRSGAVFIYDVGVSSMPLPTEPKSDDAMAAQFERIIRRVKTSMNYRGSYSTRDILGSLVARWLHSGEWERLKQLPPADRHIGESVRRFILDRIDQLRRRGEPEEMPDDLFVVPDEATLIEMIEASELRTWIAARIDELEDGSVDPRVRIPLTNARQTGRALRLHISGRTQREIAAELEVSLGVANKRIVEGTNYLVVLQGIESGLGGTA
jgi:hypothetical protein